MGRFQRAVSRSAVRGSVIGCSALRGQRYGALSGARVAYLLEARPAGQAAELGTSLSQGPRTEGRQPGAGAEWRMEALVSLLLLLLSLPCAMLPAPPEHAFGSCGATDPLQRGEGVPNATARSQL